MAEALTRLGFTIPPSQANFVWCRRDDRPVKPLYEELKKRGILVRYMNYEGRRRPADLGRHGRGD